MTKFSEPGLKTKSFYLAKWSITRAPFLTLVKVCMQSVNVGGFFNLCKKDTSLVCGLESTDIT